MRQTFAYLALALAGLQANAVDWIRDTEPSILEVHYTRTEVTDTTKRATNYFVEETMLRIGKTMSMYCSVPHYYNDSLRHCAPDLYWQSEIASFKKDPKEHDRTALERSGRYWSFVYKNYPEGKVTETDYFDTEDWRYDEVWEKPEWEITDESKEIIGYQCFMATADFRGRRWTAWFSPEIPLQEGPWKLCGLPGLILEASESSGEYSYVANGIKQSGLTDVGFLCYREKRGVNNVSRDKFFNNWWKYSNSNFGARMAAMFGNASQPSAKVTKVPRQDREETDYPHDL